jgi:hypothetical protein
MWPLAGTVLVLGGVLPSALLWLWSRTAEASLWHMTAAYNAADAIFSVAAIAVLWIAVTYGNARYARLLLRCFCFLTLTGQQLLLCTALLQMCTPACTGSIRTCCVSK